MSDNETFMRLLAAWALVHESADEGWKAAVARGESRELGDMAEGRDAFVDGLAAMIAEEKERLKAELASGEVRSAGSLADVSEHLDGVRFEIAELRGRIESLQASLDALARRESQG
jgi:phage shock protein A